MRKIEKTVQISVLGYKELSQRQKKLFYDAWRIRRNAQAPYSHYKVGCAVLTEENEIFMGVNSEVNSWTQTTHAEQNAICNAITDLGPCRIKAVAVVGAHEDADIPFPPKSRKESGNIKQVMNVCPSCGHCLQIILENCFDENGAYDPSIVLMGMRDGDFYITTIGDALPMPFLPQYLGTNYVKIIEKGQKNR